MGRDYRFIAIEGDGDYVDSLLDLFGLERDPDEVTTVLTASQHPNHSRDSLVWTRCARGTLFDFRAGYRFGWDALIVDLADLARATRARIMATDDLSTVIYDVIVLLSREGELLRHVVDTEVGDPVDIGEPLFDAGRGSGSAVWFEYPEWTPALALEWFLGFSAYDWSDRRCDAEACPSSMNVTPVRKRSYR